jgi:hypothetical protein
MLKRAGDPFQPFGLPASKARRLSISSADEKNALSVREAQLEKQRQEAEMRELAAERQEEEMCRLEDEEERAAKASGSGVGVDDKRDPQHSASADRTEVLRRESETSTACTLCSVPLLFILAYVFNTMAAEFSACRLVCKAWEAVSTKAVVKLALGRAWPPRHLVRRVGPQLQELHLVYVSADVMDYSKDVISPCLYSAHCALDRYLLRLLSTCDSLRVLSVHWSPEIYARSEGKDLSPPEIYARSEGKDLSPGPFPFLARPYPRSPAHSRGRHQRVRTALVAWKA